MDWSNNSYVNFVEAINNLGGTAMAVNTLGWNQNAIENYLNRTRIPNYNTRVSLAAELGLPLNHFA